MGTLGVHQMCALEIQPLELVRIAAEVGCQEVSVVSQPLDPANNIFPLVTADNIAALKQELAATGVGVANIEAFPIAPAAPVEAYRPALELGASLGARGATALLFDTEESRVVETLARFGEVAGEYGLRVGIEFMALSPRWNTLESMRDLVVKVGSSNVGIGIDLLHLVRSGGRPADVLALDPALFAYAQLCDGANLDVTTDYVEEAVGNRLAPGEGCFPVVDFLRALPAGAAVELEVPQPVTRPALERIGHAAHCAREQLAAAGR
ncbi:sugar phosphate isomerase/epimerase [Mangrovimicrobium sediminis]|uniref:Sugar phosphate isomerase/epimerase n=1 Tax=Mangrovimicrobium sediminis TaxID=2562682 RepID=A0A4Z0M1R5_9GAMM|nr:TIM barrel protein [Haliea sp. SAOS-164]TGD73298.1 sugar phosphate isomerase/epimerase [Haliea sp. SAOS-164]